MSDLFKRTVFGIIYSLVMLILVYFGFNIWIMWALSCIICYELFVLNHSKKLPFMLVLGYIQLCLAAWIQLSGKSLALIPIIIVWATDVFGYLVGRFYGKEVPFPEISMNKTYLGFLGSVGGGLFSAMIIRFFGYDVPVLYALMIVFTAIFGDIIGSAVKRIKNVEDASGLIPGHGGLWDRWDSFLPVGIIAILYYRFV